MLATICLVGKRFGAEVATVRSLSRVYVDVLLQIRRIGETFVAHVANVWLLRVFGVMDNEVFSHAASFDRLGTELTSQDTVLVGHVALEKVKVGKCGSTLGTRVSLLGMAPLFVVPHPTLPDFLSTLFTRDQLVARLHPLTLSLVHIGDVLL